MEYLYAISHFLITGFIPATILLALVWFLLPRFRDRLKDIVVISNTLLLAGATFFLIHSLIEFAQLVTKPGGPDYFSFDNPYLKLYWLAFLLPVVLKGVAPQILWSKKRRGSIDSSLTLVPLLLLEEFIFIRYAYNDSLASAWDYILNALTDVKGFVLPAVLYGVLVLLLYTGLKKMRR